MAKHLSIGIPIPASVLPMRRPWPTSIWSPGGFVTSALTISRKVSLRKDLWNHNCTRSLGCSAHWLLGPLTSGFQSILLCIEALAKTIRWGWTHKHSYFRSWDLFVHFSGYQNNPDLTSLFKSSKISESPKTKWTQTTPNGKREFTSLVLIVYVRRCNRDKVEIQFEQIFFVPSKYFFSIFVQIF